VEESGLAVRVVESRIITNGKVYRVQSRFTYREDYPGPPPPWVDVLGPFVSRADAELERRDYNRLHCGEWVG
jgi:hypothetical protein